MSRKYLLLQPITPPNHLGGGRTFEFVGRLAHPKTFHATLYEIL